MKVVLAQEQHIPEIVDLWEEFSRFHEPFDPRYPMKDGIRSGFQIYLKQLMAEENTKILVAIDKGKLVGYSVAKINQSSPAFKRERYGFIEEMAVTAKSRRHGVGSKILKEIFIWFKSENLDMIELSVAAKNKVGYSFWKKHGFKDYLHVLYLKS